MTWDNFCYKFLVVAIKEIHLELGIDEVVRLGNKFRCNKMKCPGLTPIYKMDEDGKQISLGDKSRIACSETDCSVKIYIRDVVSKRIPVMQVEDKRP